MSYIIVGLGNPGEEYQNTRHNTGRIMLSALAKSIGASDFVEKPKIKALVAEGKLDSEKITLVEPNNFMNRSGGSLPTLVTSVKKAEKLIVIYDDLDLPLGSVKVSFDKSSGGHNGLESIIKAVKTKKFIRIRVGISPTTPSGKLKKPKGPEAVEKHILGEFKKAEQDMLKIVSRKVIEAIDLIINSSLARAMSEVK